MLLGYITQMEIAGQLRRRGSVLRLFVPRRANEKVRVTRLKEPCFKADLDRRLTFALQLKR